MIRNHFNKTVMIDQCILNHVSLFSCIDISSFKNKTVVFTGALVIPRKEAAQAVIYCGGFHGKSVTHTTDVLVVGSFRSGKTSSRKLALAQKYQSEGRSISIISPGEFFSVIYDALQHDGNGKEFTNDCIH